MGGDLNGWTRNSRIGPYTVQRKLGEGWEGVTFLCIDRRVQDRQASLCTLKLYRRTNVLDDVRHTVEHWQRRFSGLAQVKALREWSTIAGQRRVSERPYVVFDYVPGVTLYEKIRRGHIRDPVRLSMKLLWMLAPLHARKASVGDFDHARNLIVERGTGRLVVIDLDAGTPGHPPPDMWEDLQEVLLVARKCSTHPLPPVLVKVLSEAPDAIEALRKLSGLISR